MSEQVPAGYVWHCYTKSREGDGPLFVAHDDTVTARLDGYAVIPREEYDALIAELAAFRAFLTERGCGSVGDANGMHDLAQHHEELIADNERQAARIARLQAEAALHAQQILRLIQLYEDGEIDLSGALKTMELIRAAVAALADAPGEET